MTSRRALLWTLGTVGVAALAGRSIPGDDQLSPAESPATGTSDPRPATATVDGVRDQVREVALAVRPAIIALRRRTRVVGAGWYVANGVVATATSALGTTSEGAVAGTVVEPDGTGRQATIVDAGSQEGGAVAVLDTDDGPEPLPAADSANLEPNELVVQFAHHPFLGEWFLQYGRVVNGVQDEQFLTTVQVPTAGAPTVTLDGEVVGMVVGQVPTDPPGAERPPETAAPTVHTDDGDWYRVVNVPVEQVLDRVETATD